MVDVARGSAVRGAVAGQGFRVLQLARADGQHHVDGADHERDGQVVLLGEVIAQLAQVPSGVRVALGIGVDRLPQQAHQQVAAAAGAEADLDQLDGQFPAVVDVVGTEQAMMGHAERLGQQLRVPGGPGGRQRGQDGLARAVQVIGLPRQPGPDAEGQAGVRVEQREDVLEPRLEQHGAGHGAALGYPQPGQAQGGQGHGPDVARALGQLEGLLEVPAAGAQVPVHILRAGPVREHDRKLIGRISNEFEPTGG